MEPALGAFREGCLPPECDYESRDALFKAINAWAAPRGYAFTTGKSTKEKTGRRTVTYSCDRSCRPPNSSKERQRKTTTRGTGCPFSVLAKESRDKKTWTLRHRPDERFSLHNHEPSQHPSAHPIHCTLSEEDTAHLRSLSNAGIAPKDIRTYIRQNTSSIATQQDIYNRIASARRDICEGQSTINALANQLDREGFWNRMQLGPDDRMTAVLFAHPDSLTYLQAYPDILILDCTYKTNKYNVFEDEHRATRTGPESGCALTYLGNLAGTRVILYSRVPANLCAPPLLLGYARYSAGFPTERFWNPAISDFPHPHHFAEVTCTLGQF